MLGGMGHGITLPQISVIRNLLGSIPCLTFSTYFNLALISTFAFAMAWPSFSTKYHIIYFLRGETLTSNSKLCMAQSSGSHMPLYRHRIQGLTGCKGRPTARMNLIAASVLAAIILAACTFLFWNLEYFLTIT